ncbi:helix-turn-helix domain-containing protein [Deferribacteres bacterium DY0037]|jgi:transcriptional regulator with XRE-family HTH domain
MQYKKIADRLKELRKALDMSQTDFGRKIGKNYHSVMRWELGRVLPPSNVIVHICESFDVSPDWLKSGKGKMFLNSDPYIAEAETAPYDFQQEKISLQPDSIFMPDGAAAMKAASGSTPPVSKNDIIVYNPACDVDGDGMYLIEDNYGDCYVRFYKKADRLFHSKRPDYPDVDYSQAKVTGKVIKIMREIIF